VEILPARDLVERVKLRLLQRAEQAGLVLTDEAAPPASELLVQADVSVVEQILFNLVDNCCKYAGPIAADKVIHLQVRGGPGGVEFHLRDHGPGISAEAARDLFRPFTKSAHEAAQSAPGIGLGLALSRRLARALGGDLRLDATGEGGACFVLILPGAVGAAALTRDP
jgi:signal transduction histidine kinase